MPVTLKQLSSSRGGDEVYRVDDVELHTVKLVGTISQFHDETTNYSFKINDGTGEIDCKKWKDNDSPSIFNALREGQTARVVGTIREFAGRSHLLVYSVAPVTNFNEVTHHILDVIFTHLQNTKGKVPVRIQLLLFALVTHILWLIVGRVSCNSLPLASRPQLPLERTASEHRVRPLLTAGLVLVHSSSLQ